MHVCTAVFFFTFQPLSYDGAWNIIHKLIETTWVLDYFPTKLLMSHLSIVGARRARLCVWPALPNIVFNDESMTIKHLFWGFIIWN